MSTQAHLSAAFIISVVVYFSIVAVAVVRHLSRKQFDLFEPILPFIGVYSLYAWSAGFLAETTHGGTYMGENVGSYALLLYLVSINVGLVGFLLGYEVASRSLAPFVRRLGKFFNSVSERRFSSLVLWGAILVAVFNLPTVLRSFRIGGGGAYVQWATELRLENRANVFSGVEGFVTDLSINLLISVAILYFGKSRLSKVIVPVFLVASALGAVSRGQRTAPLFVTVAILLLYHYRVQRIKFLQLFIPGILLYVAMTTFQHVRYTNHLGEMFVADVELIRNDPGVLLPTQVGELLAPSGAFLVLIDGINRGITGYTWGYSVLTELAVWVPRPLFSGRPLTLPERFMSTFFPDLYAEGRGTGFFIPMEGYWALGVPGVLLVMATVGALIAAVYKMFQANRDSQSALLLYVILFPTMTIISVRTGLLGTVKAGLMSAVPFMILLLFSRKRRSKGPHVQSSASIVPGSNCGPP